MKCIVLFTLLLVSMTAAINVSPEKIEKWENAIQPHVEKCKLESNVDPVYADRMKYLEFPKDQKFYCYMKCLYNEAGVIDAEGHVNVEELAKKFSFGNLEAAKKCEDKVETEKRLCEQAYELLLCTVEAVSE
ncbi:hypothetical protein PPYR_01524 [Photinus pyralis]|uniref:Uncharacterized protein n=1 Tax=Photinus pyralis TaxID=7054 RepID=A0A1Y1KJ61_PHOPY|nr:uncharacterized protein LOC116158651 [Photinus pyralis]XP_031350997.1 uncharacterized protein LOC116176533 [Photinus pyralis]KAB0794401.1 hypothetical protein PPYR_11240 [Photinus pyralis]KAB0804554.1 hypothetical protein PPYR_01524 [Photinus pyralis]